MATVLAWLSANWIFVVVGLVVVYLIVGNGKNPKELLDTLIGRIKEGDISGAIIATLQKSDVFVTYSELKGEAKNVVAYAKCKHDADNVPEIVDPADVDAVKAAYAVILQAIAKADTNYQVPVASRKI